MRYIRNNHYLLRSIAGEHMLVPTGEADFEPGTLLMLNETGCFLWEQLKDWTDDEELLKAVRLEFEVSEDFFEKQISEFLGLLIDNGLLLCEGGSNNEEMGKTGIEG